jgi:hypothetical protein
MTIEFTDLVQVVLALHIDWLMLQNILPLDALFALQNLPLL